MYNIAVLGDRDSIYGFASLGLDIYPVEDAQQGRERLKALGNGEYAIVYVTEWLVEQLADLVAAYDAQSMPAIIPIPGVKGNTGIGIARVKSSVEKAVGSDIIFGS